MDGTTSSIDFAAFVTAGTTRGAAVSTTEGIAVSVEYTDIVAVAALVCGRHNSCTAIHPFRRLEAGDCQE